MSAERLHREEIVRVGHMLHERQLIAGCEGNVSVRLDSGMILATPTGTCKGFLQPDDMVIVDEAGTRVAGQRKVSSEIEMHLVIYRMRPDVRAVVHAHPATATGFAVAGFALDEPLMPEMIVSLGCVPLAPYATPGTPELAESLVPLVPDYDAILLSNHGVVTYGEDLMNAYLRMETVEHVARITLVAHTLGSPRALPVEEIEKLVMARSRYERASSAPMPVPVLQGLGKK
jgi:L-fuculose-phosphate aldolase